MGKGGGAAAACGFGHHTSGRVDTLAFSVHSIAEALYAVAACAPIWAQREACQALALETTICICALSTLAGVAGALINVHTGLTIGGQLIAWITYTSEPAVHINTPTVVAHPALCTLILITTEPTIRGMLKTILAQADVGAGCVLAAAFETDERVLQTLVHINAGQSGWRK